MRRYSGGKLEESGIVRPCRAQVIQELRSEIRLLARTIAALAEESER